MFTSLGQISPLVRAWLIGVMTRSLSVHPPMGGIVRARTLLGVLAGLTLVTACVSSQPSSTSASAAPTAGVPRPDHVVIVMFENHAQGEVVGSANAPYISS